MARPENKATYSTRRQFCEVESPLEAEETQQGAGHPSCDSPSTSRFFALGDCERGLVKPGVRRPGFDGMPDDQRTLSPLQPRKLPFSPIPCWFQEKRVRRSGGVGWRWGGEGSFREDEDAA